MYAIRSYYERKKKIMNKQIKTLGFALLLILLGYSAFSQTGAIKGFVYDKDNGEPCAFANVSIDGTPYGAATRNNFV